MPAPKSRYRLGMAGAAVIALLAMPTAAVAVDDETAAQIKHYFDCLTWLLTDLPKHEAFCTPARPFEIPESKPSSAPMLGPIISPSAWSQSSSCEGECFPTSSQPTSEPSQPTSESSQSTSESTSEPSQPTSEPSQPSESQPTSEPSLPSEESQPPSESEYCEGEYYWCFPA